MIVENLEQELASQALEKTNFEDRKQIIGLHREGKEELGGLSYTLTV